MLSCFLLYSKRFILNQVSINIDFLLYFISSLDKRIEFPFPSNQEALSKLILSILCVLLVTLSVKINFPNEVTAGSLRPSTGIDYCVLDPGLWP